MFMLVQVPLLPFLFPFFPLRALCVSVVNRFQKPPWPQFPFAPRFGVF